MDAFGFTSAIHWSDHKSAVTSNISPGDYLAMSQLPLTLVFDLKDLLPAWDRHLVTCLIAHWNHETEELQAWMIFSAREGRQLEIYAPLCLHTCILVKVELDRIGFKAQDALASGVEPKIRLLTMWNFESGEWTSTESGCGSKKFIRAAKFTESKNHQWNHAGGFATISTSLSLKMQPRKDWLTCGARCVGSEPPKCRRPHANGILRGRIWTAQSVLAKPQGIGNNISWTRSAGSRWLLGGPNFWTLWFIDVLSHTHIGESWPEYNICKGWLRYSAQHCQVTVPNFTLLLLGSLGEVGGLVHCGGRGRPPSAAFIFDGFSIPLRIPWTYRIGAILLFPFSLMLPSCTSRSKVWDWPKAWKLESRCV